VLHDRLSRQACIVYRTLHVLAGRVIFGVAIYSSGVEGQLGRAVPLFPLIELSYEVECK
jgi:hypothetical protein